MQNNNDNQKWLCNKLLEYAKTLPEAERTALEHFTNSEYSLNNKEVENHLFDTFDKMSTEKPSNKKNAYCNLDSEFTASFVKLLNDHNSLVKSKDFNIKPFEVNNCNVNFLTKEEILNGEPLLLGLVTQCCLTLDRTGTGYVTASALMPNTNILKITNNKGALLACILTWQNEKGHIVLDTIDVVKMPKKRDKISPENLMKIINQTSKTLCKENSNITSVHLGIGGQTIKNLLTEDQFKELSEFGITRDNVTDVFSSKFHENTNKEEIMNIVSKQIGLPLCITDSKDNIVIENDPFDVTKSNDIHGFDSAVQCNISHIHKNLQGQAERIDTNSPRFDIGVLQPKTNQGYSYLKGGIQTPIRRFCDNHLLSTERSYTF